MLPSLLNPDLNVSPQQVSAGGDPFAIDVGHCLQCGSCYENRPVDAIEWPELQS